MINKYKRVITIGAHPLDAELMGGPMSLALNRYGAKCTMMHVTTGRLEKPGATDKEKQDYLNLLNKEINEVAETLGCDVYCMNYVSSNMPTISDFANVIYEYLKKEKADLVISHHMATMHERHYYTHKGVLQAVKRLRAEGGDIELLYGENLEDLASFVPTRLLGMLDEDVDTWFSALNKYTLYRSGMSFVPYDNFYKTMGKVRRLESNCSMFTKAYMHAPLIEYPNLDY